MTDDTPNQWDWVTWLLNNPPNREHRPPFTGPVCACGVHMYAPDSQKAGMCFLCRKQAGEATP
jgi:hypothetical protein